MRLRRQARRGRARKLSVRLGAAHSKRVWQMELISKCTMVASVLLLLAAVACNRVPSNQEPGAEDAYPTTATGLTQASMGRSLPVLEHSLSATLVQVANRNEGGKSHEPSAFCLGAT